MSFIGNLKLAFIFHQNRYEALQEYHITAEVVFY